MTNREAFNEFARGASLTVGVVGVFLLLVTLLGKPESKPKEKFKVVDTYGTCAIVRYRLEDRAEDIYFLDCGNQHLN